MEKREIKEEFKLPKRFILFDLECTTWEGAIARDWSAPGEHREVIQMGAILTETDRFSKLSTFKVLVKPKINPILSDYCIELTGITQQQIDQEGIDFPKFLQMFFEWCADSDLYCFDSKPYGARLFDRDVLMENCELLGIKFPFVLSRFHNINEVFTQYGYTVKQSGSAPEAFGIEISSRIHDALNDAGGLLIALKALSEKNRL